MKTTPGISVIIPVFNSQDSLALLISELQEVLPGITQDYEIILVNDGSQDNSWQVIRKLCQTNEKIRAFDLVRNFGQHNALLCGIRQAKYEVIVTMDDDLQHPPTEITKLLEKLGSGFDVIYGKPHNEVHNFWRNFSSKIVKWALRTAIRLPYAEKISAFRTFRTALRDNFSNYSNNYVSIDVLLSWGTTKIGFVDVELRERRIGQSQYSFIKLLTHTYNMVLGFSVVPLRLASILGFIFTFFGLIILAYVLIRYLLQGGAVPGFSFLASTIAVFSGIILFVLGIMGEYVARIYSNMITQPPYMVNEKIDKDYD